ncbi:CYTH domain-containing protein [Halomonas sp. PR-M31]|uniref:CYTH domain-containing protein n=1 Tax=Halomonas sp. PR-M31 TaxID=1471202 RepID=UPI0006508612|nr:CYTH domain-containing protein [Halomonas sp. PR-M31]
MAEEVELKLALSDSAAAFLLRHELLETPPCREWLSNTYYDTPEGALESARAALRVRRTPQGNLQTLKTVGSGSGGLFVRGEWEWAIEGDDLDLVGLADLPPIQAMGNAVLKTLEPRFVTDFERCRWLLELESASIEVAFDQGSIRADERRVEINELELELKRGDPSSLWRLAQKFAEQVPLRPSIISKAERGAALYQGHWTCKPPGASLSARLDHASRLLDLFRDTRERRFLEQAVDLYWGLANDDALSAATRHHAQALGGMLTHSDWLTTAFGQHSLSLQQTI